MVWFYVVGTIFVILAASVFFGAPYVPSRRRDVKSMFDTLRPLSKNDVVLDLGSGDGVVLREISRRGAMAIGYEIHPFFWWLSKILSTGYKNVSVKIANIWVEPFPNNVTLVYAFAVSRDGKKLVAKMKAEKERLGRPLTIVCYGSPLPGIKPAKTFEAYGLYEF